MIRVILTWNTTCKKSSYWWIHLLWLHGWKKCCSFDSTCMLQSLKWGDIQDTCRCCKISCLLQYENPSLFMRTLDCNNNTLCASRVKVLSFRDHLQRRVLAQTCPVWRQFSSYRLCNYHPCHPLRYKLIKNISERKLTSVWLLSGGNQPINTPKCMITGIIINSKGVVTWKDYIQLRYCT